MHGAVGATERDRPDRQAVAADQLEVRETGQAVRHEHVVTLSLHETAQRGHRQPEHLGDVHAEAAAVGDGGGGGAEGAVAGRGSRRAGAGAAEAPPADLAAAPAALPGELRGQVGAGHLALLHRRRPERVDLRGPAAGGRPAGHVAGRVHAVDARCAWWRPPGCPAGPPRAPAAAARRWAGRRSPTMTTSTVNGSRPAAVTRTRPPSSSSASVAVPQCTGTPCVLDAPVQHGRGAGVEHPRHDAPVQLDDRDLERRESAPPTRPAAPRTRSRARAPAPRGAAAGRGRRASSSVHRWRTAGWSRPGIGGRAGRDPVASSRRSKARRRPSASSSSRAPASTRLDAHAGQQLRVHACVVLRAADDEPVARDLAAQVVRQQHARVRRARLGAHERDARRQVAPPERLERAQRGRAVADDGDACTLSRASLRASAPSRRRTRRRALPAAAATSSGGSVGTSCVASSVDRLAPRLVPPGPARRRPASSRGRRG